jgi:hypothetical protein
VREIRLELAGATALVAALNRQLETIRRLLVVAVILLAMIAILMLAGL